MTKKQNEVHNIHHEQNLVLRPGMPKLLALINRITPVTSLRPRMRTRNRPKRDHHLRPCPYAMQRKLTEKRNRDYHRPLHRPLSASVVPFLLIYCYLSVNSDGKMLFDRRLNHPLASLPCKPVSTVDRQTKQRIT